MALKKQTFSAGDYAYLSWSNSYVISLTLTEESVDTINNTSEISYLFTISNTDNNRFYMYYYTWDIYIGGQTVAIRNFYFDLRNNYTTQIIASGKLTVEHNPDGTLAMPYNVSIPNISADNQYGPPAMSISGTYELTAIPRQKPTITATIIDVNDTTYNLTGDRSRLVRYHSYAQVTMQAVAFDGYHIDASKCTIRNGNQIVNGTTHTFYNVENGVFDFSAEDRLGNVGIYQIAPPAVDVVDYIKLSCSIEKNRPDALGNMTVSCSGNYFNGSFGAKQNTLTVQYRYTSPEGKITEWADMAITIVGNTYYATVSIEIPDFIQTASYSFETKAEDLLETSASMETGVKSLPVFDWGEHDFNVNGTLKINNLPVADYVVEQGTSGIWNYRKWNSGAAELWGIKRFVSTADAASPVSGFYLNILSVDYPFEFKDIPIAVGSYMAVGTYAFADSVFRETQKFSQRLHIYDGNKDVYANIYVSGSWK